MDTSIMSYSHDVAMKEPPLLLQLTHVKGIISRYLSSKASNSSREKTDSRWSRSSGTNRLASTSEARSCHWGTSENRGVFATRST